MLSATSLVLHCQCLIYEPLATSAHLHTNVNVICYDLAVFTVTLLIPPLCACLSPAVCAGSLAISQ